MRKLAEDLAMLYAQYAPRAAARSRIGDGVMDEVKHRALSFLTVLSLVWSAGAVGGLCYFLIGPIFEACRFLELSGVHLHYELDWPAFYSHVTWGSAWGLIFLFGLPRRAKTVSFGIWQFWLNGLLYGVPPALVEIFVYLPHEGHKIGGVDLGVATPIYILYFHTAFWSLPAYSWLCLLRPAEEQAEGYEALAQPHSEST